MLDTKLHSVMRTPAAKFQGGLSLVELMVGLVIGLVIVTGAATLFVNQIDSSRRIVLETRVNQDLRAAADLIARDLRRSGYWQNSADGAKFPPVLNPYRATTPLAGNATTVTYSFSRDAAENNAIDDNERLGFRLQNNAIEVQIGNDNWQQVTDPNSVQVTAFTITPQLLQVPLGQYCTPSCALGSAGCPFLRVRRYDIVLQGNAVSDPTVVRQIVESVRLRNDEVPIATCP